MTNPMTNPVAPVVCETNTMSQRQLNELCESLSAVDPCDRTPGEFAALCTLSFGLATRTSTLQAENERLRAVLNQIDALDPEWQGIESWHPDAVKGLVLRMGEIARTALEGGTV
jgi:hypothetical protein